MSVPVYQTTQRYIPQDCKLNIADWKQSGMENILTEGEDVQNYIIKSSVTSVQNQLPSSPEYTTTRHIGWTPQKILNLQENNSVHDQCWWEDRVVVGSQYKLLGLQDWKEA